MTWLQLNLEEGEAYALRVILSQTASPGSLQSRLITRLDAVRDEAKRERNPLKRRPVMTKRMLLHNTGDEPAYERERRLDRIRSVR